MKPFDDYKHAGGKLFKVKINSGSCRRGYGLKLQKLTGQTQCAYCGLNLVEDYAHWLLLSVDHVVPKSVGKRLGIDKQFLEDPINMVICCTGCNGFRNRDPLPSFLAHQGRWTLEAFVALRDQVFLHRREEIEKRRVEEITFFHLKPWTDPIK